MNSSRLLFLSASLLAILSLHAEEISCGHAHLKPAQVLPGSNVRRYAPDRHADLLHLLLDVTPDFKQRSLSGKATLTFKPIGQVLQELRLDAIDFTVSSVESTAKLKGHQATNDKIILTFEKPLPVGVEQTVTIHYSVTPKDGMYFRTPELGYKEGDSHLYTQGETILARNWFPVLDSPNEKLTTEVICHLPDGMKAWSNGKLLSEKKDPATGLTAFNWKQEKPHSAYLVSLVAGQFSVIEDQYKDLPLAFIVPPSDAALAKRSFDGTKEMLEFFEGELGFPFPWEKYHQIVVRDFQWGGMENTSISTLSDRTLHTADYEDLRSSISLVAHELAHQWFGDVVTCKDWSSLWLNEGFATYYDALNQERLYGREQFLNARWRAAQNLVKEKNARPIVFRNINADGYDQFGNLSYIKGSWVLHMLRSELGPDLFRQVVQTYLKRYQYQNVVTENFLSVLEEVTGRSYDRFFDQWVFHGGYPELVAEYDWDEKTGLAHVSLKQTQKTGDDVLMFHVPVKVRFKGDFGTEDRVFLLDRDAQDFHVALPSAPKIVRLDPEVALLAGIDFEPSTTMLEAQLKDAGDAMGRVLAIEQIASNAKAGSVELIGKTLNSDPQWFVREKAAGALADIGTEEALAMLRNSLTQPDARVRKAVVDAIGDFVQPLAGETLFPLLSTEKNPDIRGTILQALPRHPDAKTRAELERQLASESLRDHLFDAAVAGLRASDDTASIDPLFNAIQKRENELESRSLGQALSTLGFLARNQDNKSEILEFLLKRVTGSRDFVVNGALSGLGELADPKARPVLSALAVKAPNERRRQAAADALTTLNRGVKPPEALNGLQTDLQELQKSNSELKDELESLKKRFEAISERPGNKAGGKKKD